MSLDEENSGPNALNADEIEGRLWLLLDSGEVAALEEGVSSDCSEGSEIQLFKIGDGLTVASLKGGESRSGSSDSLRTGAVIDGRRGRCRTGEAKPVLISFGGAGGGGSAGKVVCGE